MTDTYPQPEPTHAIRLGPGVILACSGWIGYRRERAAQGVNPVDQAGWYERAGWHAFKPDWRGYQGQIPLRTWVMRHLNTHMENPKATPGRQHHAERQAELIALLD